MKNIFFIIVLSLVASFSTASTSLVFDNNTFTQQIDASQGLSSMRVYSVQRDHLGYIWFATRSGIDRYDGTHFRHYQFSNSGIITEQTGRVYRLRKDLNHRLWCFSDSGNLYCYDEMTDRFTDVFELWSSELNSESTLNDLVFLSDSICMMALSSGVATINITNGKISACQLDELSVNGFVQTDNSILALTSDGVYIYKNGVFEMSIPQINASRAFFDKTRNELWIAAGNYNLLLYKRKGAGFKKEETELPIIKAQIMKIGEVNQDIICIATDGAGIMLIDKDKKKSKGCLTAQESSQNGLRGNGVYDFLVVDQRYIWITTYTGGVTLVDAKENQFHTQQINVSTSGITHDSHINCICQDTEGDIWYATNKGIAVYLNTEKKWKFFLEQEGVFLALCQSGKSNTIWAGSFGSGLFLLDKHKGVIRHHTQGNDCALTTNSIYCIYRDAADSLWIGGMHGKLLKTDFSLKKATLYPARFVNWIGKAPHNNTAIATNNGFGIISPDNHIRWIAHRTEEKQKQLNTYIYMGMFQSDSILWLPTDGAGILRYNLNNGTTSSFTQNQGLPSNYVHAILPDSLNNIWVSTDRGLISMNLSDYAITGYSASDGLFLNSFNFNSAATLDDGELCFGGPLGSVRFNPGKIQKNPLSTGLLLTELKLSYKTVRPGEPNSPLSAPIYQTTGITLDNSQRTFSIHFGVADYLTPRCYRYRLSGYDENWIESDGQSGAQYTQVPAGKYIFEVELLSQGTRQPLESKSIKVNILSPLWLRWWAWLIYIICIGFILYKLWQLREERLRSHYSEEKTQFFIHAAHDLRTPITLVKAPLEELKSENLSCDGKNALNTALQGAERLYQMVGQFLDLQQNDQHSTQCCFQKFLLLEFLNKKILPFTNWCEQKSITLDTQFPAEDFNVVADPLLLGKIIDNLISNAIKYTPENGTVKVMADISRNFFEIRVKDTGIGIPENAAKSIFRHFFRAPNAYNSQASGSGIGLMLTQRYVRMHKGEISFVSQENQGSTFTVRIPRNLPIQQTEATVHALQQPIIPAQQQTETTSRLHTRLIYIEDNVELRTYMTHILNLHFQVISFGEAEQAQNYLKEKSADIIVSDIMLPGMQGDEFCTWVKSNMSTSHIPVILLTAKTAKADLLDGLKKGADDYLAKPFDTDILIGRIHNLIESRRFLKYRYESMAAQIKIQSNIPQPHTPESENLEEEFLRKLNETFSAHISQADYQIEQLCQEMAMSRSLLYNKLKALTGESPSEFIRKRRIIYAQALLEKGCYSVNEVAEMTGFSDAKNFSTLFKKMTGSTPGKIRK